MKNFLQLIALFLAFYVPTFAAESTPQPKSKRVDQVLTPMNEPAGRWLITMTIGGHIPPSMSLELRTALISQFAGVRGGQYRIALDVSDAKQGGNLPTVAQFHAELARIKKEIDDFKKEHPNAPTMVLFGLTGHGGSEGEGDFRFALADGAIKGTELAKAIVDLGAQETINIVQSCESGALANRIYPSLVGGFVQAINLFQNSDRNFIVMTPVPYDINSPVHTWENLLKQSFTDEAADIDGDGIVSFEDWKNYLRRNAASQEGFVPDLYRELQQKHPGLPHFSEGIDPQFYDFGTSGNSPMFFTTKGLEKYPEGLPSAVEPSAKPAEYTKETDRAYKRGAVNFMKGVLASLQPGPDNDALTAEINRLEKEVGEVPLGGNKVVDPQGELFRSPVEIRSRLIAISRSQPAPENDSPTGFRGACSRLGKFFGRLFG